MRPLSTDHTFHFELLRVLSATRGAGGDVAEVLDAAERIEPGDFESWYRVFNRLADHVEAGVKTETVRRYPVSARNALFRAASYYRAADFFLHGNAEDPRITETWDHATACFNQAIALLPIPGQRVDLAADGFTVPAIFYRAAADDRPRPTLLLCNGYDGSQEEMLHVIGFAALERGFHVLTFEGPGQPTVRRAQNLGFINEWERVVTPVLDYCQQQPAVDMRQVSLLGYSFGGFLAPRAAAFEHRLAAVMCVDGLFDAHQAFVGQLPPALQQLLATGDADRFNQIVTATLPRDTGFRWGVEQGCWSFRAATPYDFLTQVRPMTLKDVAAQITCPVLVCEAEDDHFFAGQPEALVAALGPRATYRPLTAADAAAAHCHVGASDYANGVILDWLEDVLRAEATGPTPNAKASPLGNAPAYHEPVRAQSPVAASF
ncbi:MAG: alpha/beta fold hydrolase [Bacteroidota bacterium]|nr:alpha/beta fold hydrolase [Bacteroidota bacterium]